MHPSSPRRRRRLVLGALVALGLLLAATGCIPSYPVRPGYESNSAAAAGWLEGAFADNPTGAGGLADLIFALAAVEGDRAVAEEALDQLEAATPSYVQPTPTFVNWAGAAKVMLAVHTMGGDPDGFGGLDLEAMVRGQLTPSGTNAGRFGSSNNVFGQALAIMALQRTADGVPPSSAAWLAARQCPDGGWSWGACSQVDGDYTGLAVQAMAAAGRSTDRDEGIAWLLANQNADGGWRASNEPTVSNANSTGLAVQGLQTAPGKPVPAAVEQAMAAAAAYVADLQYTSGGDAGAVPWRAGNPGSVYLATTQGVFAWGGAGPHHHFKFPAA